MSPQNRLVEEAERGKNYATPPPSSLLTNNKNSERQQYDLRKGRAVSVRKGRRDTVMEGREQKQRRTVMVINRPSISVKGGTSVTLIAGVNVA